MLARSRSPSSSATCRRCSRSASSNNSTIVLPIPIDLLTALKKTVLPEEAEHMSRGHRRGGLVDRVLRKVGLRRRAPEPAVFPDDPDAGVGVVREDRRLRRAPTQAERAGAPGRRGRRVR